MAAAWQVYDAWVSQKVFHGLDAVGLHKPGALASPLTRNLPLIASPTPQVTAVACYLAVVLLRVARLKALGPSARPLAIKCMQHDGDSFSHNTGAYRSWLLSLSYITHFTYCSERPEVPESNRQAVTHLPVL